MIGIPVTGLLWSLAVVWLNTEQLATAGVLPTQAFMVVALGGLTQTIALWAGFSAVLWAMVRAFGAHLPFTELFTLICSASLPLWVGAPALAYCLYSGKSLVSVAGLISMLSLCAFLYTAARLLAPRLSWSILRSVGAVSSAAIFLFSFTFLNN
ncbi:hypothetical protein IMCC3135_23550 [Granulosicoccus antarcticus IMCC3135]|uniref:Yip1 domain-containing protein n=1 Tax=Granulosicoccus antarcticus IMCC3135 TaxID=1192854 RepID=A0A2Z2NTZ4_9GAMM|nr:hypothetical protein IMCC3135_23550 [Granulosicoccus antarcticus IMCC3135]